MYMYIHDMIVHVHVRNCTWIFNWRVHCTCTVHVQYIIPVCVYPQLINTVYDRRGYRKVVKRVAEESIQRAVEEVKAQPDYSSTGKVMYIYL